MTEASRQPSQTADDALARLLDEEASLVAARRKLALSEAAGEATAEEVERAATPDERLALPRVGLAISGGGVRSATFGLGLLRGLAQGRVLDRVDYLSTVSGGGFVGAMFGRMVGELGIAGAQDMLARSSSPALDWLRRNGRYLTPAGARDASFAFVTYLRAILAIHVEAMLLCLPAVLLVLVPHLLLQGTQGVDFEPGAWPAWRTLWWPLALGLWLLAAPGTMTAYWAAREGTLMPRRDLGLLLVCAAAVIAASVLAWPGNDVLARGDGAALAMAGALFAGWSGVAGLAFTPLRLARSQESRSLALARIRNLLTRVLRWVTLAAVALALAGVFDVASWWLLEVMQSGETWIWGGVGLGGLAVIALRALAQPLQKLAERAGGATPGQSNWGPKLLNIAGIAGLVVLLLAWLVLVQWLVFAPEPLAALRDYGSDLRALGLAALAALWWGLTARNHQMANASSLHSFYRARLTRAYLAVGNLARGIVGGAAAPGAQSVREVLPGDDMDLLNYRPEARGGPIHLINVCLNQTRDDASRLYNADRKGTLVTASARAIEIGPREAVPAPAEAGTLGRWVAVSGAAASPGAGSYTSKGWALLLFFLGVRLGYWLPAPRQPAAGWPPAMQRLWTLAIKPLMLVSEVSASFFGTARPWWYLSDGGHFDNTGVYALLKRRLDFIVLADNSADADYGLADIENLVRKARIDFGAEIEFYTHDEAARMLAGTGNELTVLSPEALADSHSARGVLLARIRYAADAAGRRAEGTLLVVKPNLHDALDLDLLAYAQRHPTFPHESTGDQSFDESQWESYQRLGEDFGRAITLPWLEWLPGWMRPAAHPNIVAARLRGDAAVRAAAADEPLWRRSARATAIGTTLGLSASGTLLLGLWQVSEQLRQDSATQQAEASKLFTEVSKELRDLDGSCPKVAEHTAIQLMLLRDLRRGQSLRPLEREGVDQLFVHVREECQQQPAASIDCADAVRRAGAGICAVVNKPWTQGTALSYWHATPGRITLAGLFRAAPDEVMVASAPTAPAPAPDRAEPAAPPPKLTTRGEDPASAAEAPASAAAPAAAAAVQVATCGQDGRRVQLYVQIYDEASRAAATAVVRELSHEFGEALAVAPIENVTRAAEVRGQRRPAPWPQPTLIVHDAADKACAADLAKGVRAVLPAVPGRAPEVWVRDLPRSLKPQAGVIELWIPPREAAPASAI
ncbi:MAG: patatin-like phospholipase family protein [Piscinibacter sp.]|nr:patatin-like phospholipase family protein [Piscinibacter sp.]